VSFAYLDRHGLPLCRLCVDGILFEDPDAEGYTTGLTRGDEKDPQGVPCREYVWKKKPSDETLAAFEAYLANPVCTPRRHAWYEDQVRARAQEEAEAAREKYREIIHRKPGWSIE
jgi:hypothetical protein